MSYTLQNNLFDTKVILLGMSKQFVSKLPSNNQCEVGKYIIDLSRCCRSSAMCHFPLLHRVTRNSNRDFDELRKMVWLTNRDTDDRAVSVMHEWINVSIEVQYRLQCGWKKHSQRIGELNFGISYFFTIKRNSFYVDCVFQNRWSTSVTVFVWTELIWIEIRTTRSRDWHHCSFYSWSLESDQV